MGLYDDRLASLSESRSPRGAGRQARSSNVRVQSFLFERDAGWTPSKARAWAKSQGYGRGKVHVTEQHVRIRQFGSDEGAKIHRTVPFGRGIRAVVAREGQGSTSMATPRTVNASRRKKKTSRRRKKAGKRRARVTAVAAPKRKRKRKVRAVAEAPRKRRAAKRRPAKRKKTARRRKKKVSEAWRGDTAGHRKAAKKGWKRRKKSGRTTTKRRKPRRKAKEASVVQAPKRRRTSKRRRSSMVMAPKRRRTSKRRMRSPMGGGGGIVPMIVTGLSGGLGFVVADGIDRLLATYNPSATEQDTKDGKFRSDGAGTLGNTLNVASRPGLVRAGAAVGVVAIPALGAMYIKNRTAKTALTAAAFGAGINGFKLLWNNAIMPMLRPKDASPAELQKSVIARLYPSEVSAAINLDKKNADGSERVPQMSVSSGGSGALSGAGDVGPFALAAPEYPTAAQAISRATGIASPGADWPTTAQAIAQQTGRVGDQWPTAAQALARATGQVGAPWQPGPPSSPGPGPQPDEASCGCAGIDPYSSFLDEN